MTAVRARELSRARTTMSNVVNAMQHRCRDAFYPRSKAHVGRGHCMQAATHLARERYTTVGDAPQSAWPCTPRRSVSQHYIWCTAPLALPKRKNILLLACAHQRQQHVRSHARGDTDSTDSTGSSRVSLAMMRARAPKANSSRNMIIMTATTMSSETTGCLCARPRLGVMAA